MNWIYNSIAENVRQFNRADCSTARDAQHIVQLDRYGENVKALMSAETAQATEINAGFRYMNLYVPSRNCLHRKH